jgi:Holliday junction resolvase-like predicted endonuclease
MQPAKPYPHIDQFMNAIPQSASFQRILRPHRWDMDSLRQLERQEIASLGESVIAAWAQKAGWTTLGRQLRGRGYELDLVTLRGNECRIIEVKTRLFPRQEPDLYIMSNWLSSAKQAAITRGVHDLIHRGRIGTRGSISVELFAVDILRDLKIRVYRWPDVFSISEHS